MKKLYWNVFIFIWWTFPVNRTWVSIKFTGITINLLDENWDKNKILLFHDVLYLTYLIEFFPQVKYRPKFSGPDFFIKLVGLGICPL